MRVIPRFPEAVGNPLYTGLISLHILDILNQRIIGVALMIT